MKPSNQNVHTQNIERKWRSLKDSLPKSSNGPNRADYLIEFIYKTIHHSNNQAELSFYKTIEHLKNDPFAFENEIEISFNENFCE